VLCRRRIILATITLTAFLQPGMKGFVSGNAAEIDTAECLDQASEKFLQKVEGKLNATAEWHTLSYPDQALMVCYCTPAADEIVWEAPFATMDKRKCEEDLGQLISR